MLHTLFWTISDDILFHTEKCISKRTWKRRTKYQCKIKIESLYSILFQVSRLCPKLSSPKKWFSSAHKGRPGISHYFIVLLHSSFARLRLNCDFVGVTCRVYRIGSYGIFLLFLRFKVFELMLLCYIGVSTVVSFLWVFLLHGIQLAGSFYHLL